MIDRKKIKIMMIEKNDSVQFLAKYLNISRQSLYSKMVGRTRFNEKEISLLIKRYGETFFTECCN